MLKELCPSQELSCLSKFLSQTAHRDWDLKPVLTCLRVAAGLKGRLRPATHPGCPFPAECSVGSDASRRSVGRRLLSSV